MNEQEKIALAQRLDRLDYVYSPEWDYTDECPYVVFWNAAAEKNWCVLFAPTHDESVFPMACRKASETVAKAIEQTTSYDGKHGIAVDDVAWWYELYISDAKGLLIEIDLATGTPLLGGVQ